MTYTDVECANTDLRQRDKLLVTINELYSKRFDILLDRILSGEDDKMNVNYRCRAIKRT